MLNRILSVILLMGAFKYRYMVKNPVPHRRGEVILTIIWCSKRTKMLAYMILVVIMGFVQAEKDYTK